MNHLISYSKESNQKYIQCIKGKDLPEAYQWMSHIVNAHHIWNQRILGLAKKYDIDTLHDAQTLEQINDQNHQTSLQILANKPLDELVFYKNLKGLEFSNSISQILTHLVNHSTYHRGQVSTILKREHISVPVTDLIAFYRELSI